MCDQSGNEVYRSIIEDVPSPLRCKQNRSKPNRNEVGKKSQAEQETSIRSFSSLESLVSLLANEATDEGKIDIREQLLDLKAEEHDVVWQRVYRMTSHLLCCESVESGEAEQAVSAVATLVVNFTEHVMDVETNPDLPPAFFEVAKLCETVLVHIPDANAQGSILQALEKICVDGFRGREHFIGRVVLFLLSRCAGPRMTSADVTRLYRVHSLLEELDWDDDSIRCVKEMAIQCIANSAFIRCKHGQDMLAIFYASHASFVAEVDSEVKKQVLSCRQSVLEKFAAGLYKGWKQAEGDAKVEVESCVQQWAELAIRANHKAADSARTILNKFHFYHLSDESTHELLCRIYAPVLWRSLKVANPQVRLNAVKLLQYVFPLASKTAGVEQEELEIIKEVHVCREILEDPSEAVRRSAVGVVCTIIKNFWSFLPSHEVEDLLKLLSGKCARDKKSATVRAAVAEGFALILQNPRTHHTMSEVLTQVGHLLHDRHPVVRSGFMALVKMASHCKVIDKTQVAPGEELYMRLVYEHAEAQMDRLQKSKSGATTLSEKNPCPDTIAKQLASLLQKDLFPVNGDTLNNVVTLIDALPLGIFAVLSNLDDGVPMSERVKLAALLFVRVCLKLMRDAAPGEDDQASKHEQLAAKTLQVVALLLQGTMAVLNTQKREEQEGGCGKEAKFPPQLEDFVYQHFKEEDFLPLLSSLHEDSDSAVRLKHHLLIAISHLDPVRLPDTVWLVRHQLLLACKGNSDTFAAYGSALQPRLQALLHIGSSWHLLSEALDAAVEHINAAATRLSQRKPASDDAANVLMVMSIAFKDPLARSAILRSRSSQMKQLVATCAAAFCKAWSNGVAKLQKLELEADLMLLGPSADLWPRFLGLILRMALHLQCRRPSLSCPADEVLIQIATALTDVSTKEVLQHLVAKVGSRPADAPKRKKRRSSSVCDVPADLNYVVQVHKRTLEAFNATELASASRATAPECEQQAASAARASIFGALVDRCQQWSCILDPACTTMSTRASEVSRDICKAPVPEDAAPDTPRSQSSVGSAREAAGGGA